MRNPMLALGCKPCDTDHSNPIEPCATDPYSKPPISSIQTFSKLQHTGSKASLDPGQGTSAPASISTFGFLGFRV